MRAVIEASWRLLDGDQQRALARLSVFRGGFDPAAAEAVAGAEVAMLSALVERSLVDRAEGGRYGLHELLRQFAAERLEAAGDAAATRRPTPPTTPGSCGPATTGWPTPSTRPSWPRSTPRPATCGRPGRSWPRRTGSRPWPASSRTCGWSTAGTAASRRRWGRSNGPWPARTPPPGSGPGGTCGPGWPSTSSGGPRRGRRSCGPCWPWPTGPCRRPAPAGSRPWPGAPPGRPAAAPSAPGRRPTRRPAWSRPMSPRPMP